MHADLHDHPPHFETANDRMKRRSADWTARSIVLAVLLHFAVFNLTPSMYSRAWGSASEPPKIVIPDDIEIPDPPAAIQSPAEPVMGSTDIPNEVTIANTTCDDWKPPEIAPPVRTEGRGSQEYERFTLSMVAPEILNVAEVERALQRNYPPILRDAGIGGKVYVNIWLDEKGTVMKAELAQSSGYPQMDAAALDVVDVMRLSPAQNRGRA